MKLTNKQLVRIIKEEIKSVLNEELPEPMSLDDRGILDKGSETMLARLETGEMTLETLPDESLRQLESYLERSAYTPNAPPSAQAWITPVGAEIARRNQLNH